MVVVKCRVETIEPLDTSASLHYQLYYQETMNMSKRHSLVDTLVTQEPKQQMMPCKKIGQFVLCTEKDQVMTQTYNVPSGPQINQLVLVV